jgi:hypothetical protein
MTHPNPNPTGPSAIDAALVSEILSDLPTDRYPLARQIVDAPDPAKFADAVLLVQRAAAGVLTKEAGERLRAAVASHNDGRVRRFLEKAAAARDRARTLTGDPQEQMMIAWARWLHRALDESWPTDHPAYRRYDGAW